MKVRVLLLVVLAIATLWLGWWASRPPEPVAADETLSPTPAAAVPAPAPVPGAPQIAKPPSVEELLGTAYEKLARIAPGDAAAFLDELRRHLASYPPGQAATAIRDFLASKRDRVTNLPLRIGPDGKLSTAPTIRVWLLDELSRIDLNAAATQAESILASRESADEWAIALRAYARARPTPEGAAFLKEKLRELWNDPRWQQERSPGWLEAFDLAVHLRAPDLAEDLSRMVVHSQREARPTAHAAYQTLDRLLLVQPAAVLDQLQKNPEWLRGEEQRQAALFARADPRDPQQRAILESYLLDSARDPAELEKFASLFPNANRGAGSNLLTHLEPASPEEVAAQDREALRLIGTWEADARFQTLRPHLAAIRNRIAGSSPQPGGQ